MSIICPNYHITVFNYHITNKYIYEKKLVKPCIFKCQQIANSLLAYSSVRALLLSTKCALWNVL